VILGGTLNVSSDGNLGTAGGGVILNGGTLQYGAGFSSARGVELDGSSGTIDTNGNNSTLSGVISGTGLLTKINSGTLTLGGNNTYSGATTISGGTLALSGAGSIASSSGVTLTPGAFFDISTATAPGATIPSLSGTGGTLTLGSNTLTLSSTIPVVFFNFFSGVINGTGGLTLAAGPQILAGSNGYTGVTTISGGVLALNGAGSIANSSGVLLAAGAAFDISLVTGPGATIKSLAGTGGSVLLGSDTLTLSNASGTFAGTIKGPGGLTLTAGTETLLGSNTYQGATTISGGTLELAAGASTGTGTIAFNGPVAKLQIDGTTMPSNAIDTFALGDIIDLHGLKFVAGATANYDSVTHVLTVTSNGISKALTLTNPAFTTFSTPIDDCSGGTQVSLIATASQIQAEDLAITRTALSLDQATTVANELNSATLTEAQFINNLLGQVTNTTIPAVAVEASMYGAVGSSAEITKLVTLFLPAQVANAIQHSLNPQVYACEVLGLAFAFGDENGGTAFANNFGPSNSAMPATHAGDVAFAAAASSTIFGSAANAGTPGAILNFVTNWEAFYTSHGIPGVANATASQIDLAARAAAWGDAVGVALANNLGPLPGQVINFLEDAAQGTALYFASLASQPMHAPFFQGAAAASVASAASHVQLTGVAAPVDHLIM
jgi:autotransporter-associated beta strand protein